MPLLDDAPRCRRHGCIMLPASVPGPKQAHASWSADINVAGEQETSAVVFSWHCRYSYERTLAQREING
jgi:hypothetical protein